MLLAGWAPKVPPLLITDVWSSFAKGRSCVLRPVPPLLFRSGGTRVIESRRDWISSSAQTEGASLYFESDSIRAQIAKHWTRTNIVPALFDLCSFTIWHKSDAIIYLYRKYRPVTYLHVPESSAVTSQLKNRYRSIRSRRCWQRNIFYCWARSGGNSSTTSIR